MDFPDSKLTIILLIFLSLIYFLLLVFVFLIKKLFAPNKEIQKEHPNLKTDNSSLLIEKEQLNQRIKNLSSQIQNSEAKNILIQGEVNDLLNEQLKLQYQLNLHHQTNERNQNEIQVKQQSFQFLGNLIEDLTNQFNEFKLEKEQIKIDFEDIQSKIASFYIQYQSKLSE
jgi:chromosome segregation ATPase